MYDWHIMRPSQQSEQNAVIVDQFLLITSAVLSGLSFSHFTTHFIKVTSRHFATTYKADPWLFDTVEIVVVDCPVLCLCLFVAYSAALHRYKLHHQSLTDYQRSEMTWSTPPPAATQSSWWSVTKTRQKMHITEDLHTIARQIHLFNLTYSCLPVVCVLGQSRARVAEQLGYVTAWSTCNLINIMSKQQ